MIASLIFSKLTIPGAIVHVIVQRIFADLAKVPVHEICYFQTSDLKKHCYLILAPIKSVRSAFFIFMGPLLINTLLCAVLTFPAYAQIYTIDNEADYLTYFLIFLGLAIGVYAIPSNDALDCLMSTVLEKPTDETTIKRPPNTVSLVFLTLLTACLKVINGLTFLGSHLWYALGISQVLPYLCGFYQS